MEVVGRPTFKIRRPAPGTAVVSKFTSLEWDDKPVAAVAFSSTPGEKHVKVDWFHSEEEASLWLDSAGIPNFQVPKGKLDVVRLKISGEIFDPRVPGNGPGRKRRGKGR